MLGPYIDALPARARDRIIEAQNWCIAEVLGPGGSRCLVGHAENWSPLSAGEHVWRRWDARPAGEGGATDTELYCAPQLFAFRRCRPADMAVYRARIQRWGPSSEGALGARFDSLCVRLGVERAVRLVKQRAARAHRLADSTVPAAPPVVTAGA